MTSRLPFDYSLPKNNSSLPHSTYYRFNHQTFSHTIKPLLTFFSNLNLNKMTDGQYLVVRAQTRNYVANRGRVSPHPDEPSPCHIHELLLTNSTYCPHYIESDKSGGLDDQYELILLQKYFKFHAPISVDCNQVW